MGLNLPHSTPPCFGSIFGVFFCVICSCFQRFYASFSCLCLDMNSLFNWACRRWSLETIQLFRISLFSKTIFCRVIGNPTWPKLYPKYLILNCNIPDDSSSTHRQNPRQLHWSLMWRADPFHHHPSHHHPAQSS